ncbi:MAG TPA: histone deacetylase family protein [Candidatus Limnocylindrales bacterium]|nr:histone deacetylase family protein [Candidatus Limnocylindrales bacterium]
MQVVHSPLHLGHEPPFEVSGGRRIPAYEVRARAEAIREALAADAGFALREPEAFGSEPITAVHDPDLLRYLETAWAEWREQGTGEKAILPDTVLQLGLRESMGRPPEPSSPCGRVGYWCYDTATAIVESTYVAARAAVDVALTTARLVLDGERQAYGLCRPPGHHAARAMFGGYCYFNNAAVAAEWLVRRTGEPVAVLDVDVHHGNGTQQIFWTRPDVLYVSLHADPRGTYPYFAGFEEERGAGAGEGANLNLPLAPGTGDAAYLAALEHGLERIAAHGGSLVVVSLGFDTYEQDPIGPLALTTAAYHEMGRRVAALGRRLVILQEGGYHVPALGANAVAWLRGADGRPASNARPRAEAPASAEDRPAPASDRPGPAAGE